MAVRGGFAACGFGGEPAAAALNCRLILSIFYHTLALKIKTLAQLEKT
jgi:hypothetical protein